VFRNGSAHWNGVPSAPSFIRGNPAIHHLSVCSPSSTTPHCLTLHFSHRIPDIMRHYANLIEHAETEVFLATNYWEPSHSATLVTSALKTLSRKVGERKGEKVVVKLMYDRGTPKQVVTNHAKVEPKDWGKVDIPAPEEIPNLQLEVMVRVLPFFLLFEPNRRSTADRTTTGQ
jgi:phosphatidylserine/phosphatidylglycerophosphate/cardiolipin synthase-like enzyme